MDSCVEERSLSERLAPRLKVERWFVESGRTYRRGPLDLWYKRRIEPRILKLGLQAAGLYRRGVRNAQIPVLRHLRLSFANLPAVFDGFRVLHLSDFHIDGNQGLAERIGALLHGVEADLCVFTGDYRFDIQGPCDGVYDPMRRTIGGIHSKHGILGILGNHDAAEIAFALEEMGARMLANEAVEISRRGDSIWVAGIDDPFDYRCDDLPRALAGIPPDAFTVLLAHTPDRYREAAASGVDLYLCGHTHAGQIRLPILGSIKHNSKTPRLYSYGLWTHRQMQGYTTAGIGCSALPVRYNCPPEAVLIELHRDSTT
ncbi:MAG: metallophosphoesterase family protein [Acidobacteriaceae bacterium]|nr:metallophosphoesterase family protein [Acidobacteriaceae bacterium]